MEFHICAPGPSMSAELCDRLRGKRVGVVGKVFELAPWAEFLAANDIDWWTAYPEAKKFAGARYTSHSVDFAQKVQGGLTEWSSGVLALQVCMLMSASRIYLHGFDHHGTHYFGPYENGLSNTPPERRAVHQRQFTTWAAANSHIEILNATPGSALQGFPMVEYA
jgi:hypothetical protein